MKSADIYVGIVLGVCRSSHGNVCLFFPRNMVSDRNLFTNQVGINYYNSIMLIPWGPN